MYAGFVRLLNMSAVGTILIAVVIVLRVFLRKTPKKYICLLWAIVALRLVCPVSISSAVSAFNYIGGYTSNSTAETGQIEYIHYNGKPEKPQAEVYSYASTGEHTDGPTVKVQTSAVYLLSVMEIWAIGAGAMLIYAVCSYAQLHRRVAESMRLGRNIYVCDRIPTPFILGIAKPKIYLPSELNPDQRRSVVAHERAHIARLDHWWKPLGYAILCVHWFNPLVWVAYGLMCRDIEMACDEKVIRNMTPAEKKEYATVLLSCSLPGKFITASPLAFGETSVKQRIRGISRYRKPSFWAAMAAIIVCICVGVGFLTNPKRDVPVEPVGDSGSISFGEMHFTLPQGYQLEMQTTDAGVITSENGTVGGVQRYPMEVLPFDMMGWMQELPLTEWEDDTLGNSAGGGGDQYSIHFFSDVPPDQPRTVQTQHNFYHYNGWLYDLWLDELRSDTVVRIVILDTVHLGAVPGVGSAEAALAYEIGELPMGYSHTTEPDGSIQFRSDHTVVGGIVGYAIPAGTYDPDDRTFGWLEKLGISDYGDETLQYYGGMTFDDDRWSADFGSDSPQKMRSHVFQVAGNYVYDIWFDGLQVERDVQYEIRSALKCTTRGIAPDANTAIHSQTDAEETAFRAVEDFRHGLEEAGAAYVTSERRPKGTRAPNYRIVDCSVAEEEALMNILEIEANGKDRAESVMMVSGERYTNAGHEYDHEEQTTWAKSPGEFLPPWLLSFDWSRQSVQYRDTVQEDGGTTYRFYADYLYYDEEENRGYDIYFHFNTDGQFSYVRLEINAGKDTAYTVTEMVLNTDAGNIHSSIQREYQRAAG